MKGRWEGCFLAEVPPAPTQSVGTRPRAALLRR